MRDYGQEAIEILLQVMENQREDIVVVLAGYHDRMERFFESNPGMGSRIAEPAREAFGRLLVRRMEMPRFANARSVRNALERAWLRQADRLVSDAGRLVGRDDLMRIDAEDILRSRCFAGVTPAVA